MSTRLRAWGMRFGGRARIGAWGTRFGGKSGPPSDSSSVRPVGSGDAWGRHPPEAPELASLAQEQCGGLISRVGPRASRGGGTRFRSATREARIARKVRACGRPTPLETGQAARAALGVRLSHLPPDFKLGDVGHEAGPPRWKRGARRARAGSTPAVSATEATRIVRWPHESAKLAAPPGALPGQHRPLPPQPSGRKARHLSAKEACAGASPASASRIRRRRSTGDFLFRKQAMRVQFPPSAPAFAHPCHPPGATAGRPVFAHQGAGASAGKPDSGVG